ncbi:MAG: metallophosphoesterase family protein [Deltaproteobacteria bacterium]
MRFLFFTDTHIRGTNPKSRLDDYYLALKNKFEEIVDIIKKNDIDYVIHGGDWFDRPDIAPSIVRDFAVLVKKFDRPVYSVAGNHDIFGHNPETISRTMLGLLEGTDVIKIIEDNKPVIIEKDDIKVQIYGHSYSYEIDEKGLKESYIVKKNKDCDYCINIVHGMLLPKAFIEGIKYTTINEISSTEADITLAGHYHSGFGIKKVNERFFVNLGSLARISALKSEIERIPQVVVIELKEEINIWTVPLECAKAGEEILDREHIENAQNRAYKLNQFFQNIDASGDYKQIKIDINDIIEQIVTAQGISDKVKVETIKRIEQARSNIAGEEVEA